MHTVAIVAAAALAPASGAVAAAFTLPLVERRGWGLLPPRLVAGLRAHSHTGTEGMGLYRRAWRWHLLYGLVVGASVSMFLPLFVSLPGGNWLADPTLLFVPPFVAYAAVVFLVYVLVSGCRDRAVLLAVAVGIAAHLAVLAVLANVGYSVFGAITHENAGRYVALALGTVVAAGIVAVRAKGFEGILGR